MHSCFRVLATLRAVSCAETLGYIAGWLEPEGEASHKGC